MHGAVTLVLDGYIPVSNTSLIYRFTKSAHLSTDSGYEDSHSYSDAALPASNPAFCGWFLHWLRENPHKIRFVLVHALTSKWLYAVSELPMVSVRTHHTHHNTLCLVKHRIYSPVCWQWLPRPCPRWHQPTNSLDLA